MKFKISMSALFFLAFVNPSFSQIPYTELYKYSGPADAIDYGDQISNIGDLDQDGFDDLAISSPQFNATPGSLTTFDHGLVEIRSGHTGTLIYSIVGDISELGLGTRIMNAGDFNNDGVNDIIIGSLATNIATFSSLGNVRIISGGNSSVLLLNEFGNIDQYLGSYAIAAPGDLNQDGFDDIIAGSFDGSLIVYFGNGYGLGTTIQATFYGVSGFGCAVESIPDLNGDGISEIGVGTCQQFGSTVPSSFAVYSGASLVTNSLVQLYSTNNFSVSNTSSYFMKSKLISDLDGDGKKDIFVSNPYLNSSVSSAPLSGEFRILSGATGTTLCSGSGTLTNQLYGSDIADLGDLNGDGIVELLLGEPRLVSPPRANLINCNNGMLTTLTTYTESSFSKFGRNFATGYYNSDTDLDLVYTLDPPGSLGIPNPPPTVIVSSTKIIPPINFVSGPTPVCMNGGVSVSGLFSASATHGAKFNYSISAVLPLSLGSLYITAGTMSLAGYTSLSGENCILLIGTNSSQIGTFITDSSGNASGTIDFPDQPQFSGITGILYGIMMPTLSVIGNGEFFSIP